MWRAVSVLPAPLSPDMMIAWFRPTLFIREKARSAMLYTCGGRPAASSVSAYVFLASAPYRLGMARYGLTAMRIRPV